MYSPEQNSHHTGRDDNHGDLQNRRGRVQHYLSRLLTLEEVLLVARRLIDPHAEPTLPNTVPKMIWGISAASIFVIKSTPASLEQSLSSFEDWELESLMSDPEFRADSLAR